MDFTLVFVDHNSEFIKHAEKMFASELNVNCQVGSIQDIPTQNAAFVSPANSMLFMCGGVDATLSRIMFKDVECKLRRHKLPKLGIQTTLGRHILPIGSATITPVGETTYLISAPTMFLPHDVSQTHNAYHAFMAALCCMDKFRSKGDHPEITRMVCTAMCTGWGKMPAEKAATQMYTAYHDYREGRRPEEIMLHDDPEWFISHDHHEEQPDNFDNREIKEIHI